METQEHMDLTTASTQLKRLRVEEQPPACKKTKTSRTLEGDLLANKEPVHDITTRALEKLMTEKTTVLGVLSVQLQVLQVQPPRGMIPNLADNISVAEQMVHAPTTNTLRLPVGDVIAEAEGNVRN